MTKLSTLTGASAFAFFAAAALAQSTDPLAVREVMADEVNPAVLAIWDVGNNAMNDDGGLDPAQMTPERWEIIETQAKVLAASGRAMAGAAGFLAAQPGNTIVGEGEVQMNQIQAQINADPAGFRAMGGAMADHAERLAAAARARDAAATADLISGMDAVCEGCHARYWYPEA